MESVLYTPHFCQALLFCDSPKAHRSHFVVSVVAGSQQAHSFLHRGFRMSQLKLHSSPSLEQ